MIGSILYLIFGLLVLLILVAVHSLIWIIGSDQTFTERIFELVEDVEVTDLLAFIGLITIWPVSIVLGSIMLAMFFCDQMKGKKIFSGLVQNLNKTRFKREDD